MFNQRFFYQITLVFLSFWFMYETLFWLILGQYVSCSNGADGFSEGLVSLVFFVALLVVTLAQFSLLFPKIFPLRRLIWSVAMVIALPVLFLSGLYFLLLYSVLEIQLIAGLVIILIVTLLSFWLAATLSAKYSTFFKDSQIGIFAGFGITIGMFIMTFAVLVFSYEPFERLMHSHICEVGPKYFFQPGNCFGSACLF